MKLSRTVYKDLDTARRFMSRGPDRAAHYLSPEGKRGIVRKGWMLYYDWQKRVKSANDILNEIDAAWESPEPKW